MRSKYKIPLVRELHIYELLATVLRQTHAHPEVNRYISRKETHFDPEKRNTILKTEIRLTKQNKKSIKVRVRILCNVLVRYDISILKNILLLAKKQLDSYLHGIRDVYIYENPELLAIFW